MSLPDRIRTISTISGPPSTARRGVSFSSLPSPFVRARAAFLVQERLAGTGAQAGTLRSSAGLHAITGAATLESPALVRATFARWLFWRAYITHQAPTHTGLERAVRALVAVWRRRAAQSRPLSRADAPDIPDPTDLDLENADVLESLWGEQLPDTADAWATLAEEAGDAALVGDELAAVAGALSLEDFLGNALGIGLSALQVARMLDGAWDGQAMLDGMDSAPPGTPGVSGDFNLWDPYTYGYMQQQVGYKITGYDETTTQQIAQFLQQQMYLFAGGTGSFTPQSVDSIAGLLQNLSSLILPQLGLWSDYRAFMIATTEMARAQTFGAFAQLWLAGVQAKRWMATAGACQRCVAAAEAGAIPLMDSFPGPVLAPPMHPLCRCSIVAAIPDTFNPNAWQPRAPDALQALLGTSALAQWPSPDAFADVDPGLLEGRGAKADPYRVSAYDVRLGKELVRLAALAAAHWAAAAGVRVPATIPALRTLFDHEPARTAAGDAAWMHVWRQGGEALRQRIAAGAL